ncbi:MAG: outer membrane beta-barrel protein [Gammaproteobacteria bacterium]|nr:outer membrane beta-barrel protein [Gammaproteobacteria bacterium]
MQKSRLRRGLLATVVTLVAFSLNLHAAEWVAEPSISLREEYNDNLRLTTIDDHEDTWTTTLDPRLKLSRRTEQWDLNASARVRAQAYEGGDGIDNTVDNFLDLASRRRFERGSWDASVSQINDTTTQTEELDLDTGLTIRQIDRTRRSYTIGSEYMFTETTWLQGSVGYRTAEYDDNVSVGGGSTDYDTLSPSLTIVHQLNPRTQVFGVYSHAITKYDNNRDTESTTDSLQLGAEYNFTETWKLNGSVGYQQTQTDQTFTIPVPRSGFEAFFPSIFDVARVTEEIEDSGLVFNMDLSRTFETGSLGLIGSRSVNPGSDGNSSEVNSLTLRGSRKFSAKLSGNLAVSYLQSSEIGTIITDRDRTRYRIAPSLAWQLDRDLRLDAGYTYTSVDNDTASNDTATSNAAFIGLGYTWPRMAVSR